MARKPAPPSPRPLLEWLVAGLGLIVTAAVLIVLGLAALAPASPPELSARAASVTRVSAGFRVEVEVRNSGRDTAAGVEVEGVLTPPVGLPETATATLDYVPGGGTETLTLLFREDPRRGRIALMVRGWSEP